MEEGVVELYENYPDSQVELGYVWHYFCRIFLDD